MNTSSALAGASREGMRVAIYMRLACVLQSDRGSDLDPQRRMLLDLIARNDLELAAEYCDVPASGLDSERPGLLRMIKDAKAEHCAFDVVLVESPCRLSRNFAELYGIARELGGLGIQLCWVEGDRIVSAPPASNSDSDREGS